MYKAIEDFERLRNEWALKATVSEGQVDMERRMDHSANPHNEPYHNKRPRRTDAEIVADICFSFADAVLMRQYGRDYQKWLETNTKKTPHLQNVHSISRNSRDY